MPLLRVAYGKGDMVVTEDGDWYVDLISSTGAVFLGHANDAINHHVTEQMGRISCSWTSTMEVQDRCREAVARRVGPGLSLHSLYSSGMEAAEVAIRMAFLETGRPGIVGFRGGHHGKSVAVQAITGPDPDLPPIDTFRRLPFVPEVSEDEVLDHLARALSAHDVAAVVIEPVLGRGGGHSASAAFHHELQRLCHEAGTLVICDEIFTGFHRTGPCLNHPALGLEPDIVLVGKAIANGFPASGVLLTPRFHLHPKDFRFSSTFSDNPLACAAVVGTLEEMDRIGIEAEVARIERAFRTLDGGPGSQLRLHGAACFLELASPLAAASVQEHLLANRVLALQRGATLGFWPPATITDDNLRHVVSTTGEALAARR